MAGLAAAWRLSRPDGRRPEITVYQRGSVLGGKGASTRGPDGRIQEHGLHVWPGYYDNAFRLIRDVYAELDRPVTDPSAPIATFDDAFLRGSTIGLGHEGPQGWARWMARFPENDLVPGDGDGSDLSPRELISRSTALVARFAESLVPDPEPPPRAALSSRSSPPKRSGFAPGLSGALANPTAAVRAAHLADLLTTMGRGVLADGLGTRGYGAVDDLDFRQWLESHGASRSTLAGPLVMGMYDFVFGYRDGDRERPSFSAGLGLQLTGRLFLTYRGAVFWKMRAGMGDVVFAPLYEALRRRGVRFEFFHRLDHIGLDPDNRSVVTVQLGRQAALAAGVDEYDPLVRVGRLPVFPDRPDPAQLAHETGLLEDQRQPHPDAGTVELRAGRDFDDVVLAVSIGVLPSVAGELIGADQRWRDMVEHVATVATQSFQVWLMEDERALGWEGGAAVMTGCGAPFDTFASMSHTLPFETWPSGGRPRTAASFCAVLPDPPAVAAAAPPDAAAESAAVRSGAVDFLDQRAGRLWPDAVTAGKFRCDLFAGGTFDAQYWRANTDPSDRYVQSLPGTSRFRLAANASGFGGLHLAGDWIDSGLNAGCIEAAVLAGLQAANSVEGLPAHEGTTGFRPSGTG